MPSRAGTRPLVRSPRRRPRDEQGRTQAAASPTRRGHAASAVKHSISLASRASPRDDYGKGMA
eukprot:8431747-Pyramimonas_sp.AAC.1